MPSPRNSCPAPRRSLPTSCVKDLSAMSRKGAGVTPADNQLRPIISSTVAASLEPGSPRASTVSLWSAPSNTSRRLSTPLARLRPPREALDRPCGSSHRYLSDPLLSSCHLRIDLGEELQHQPVEGLWIFQHQQMVGARDHV